jgi:hypothetical protein
MFLPLPTSFIKLWWTIVDMQFHPQPKFLVYKNHFWANITQIVNLCVSNAGLEAHISKQKP